MRALLAMSRENTTSSEVLLVAIFASADPGFLALLVDFTAELRLLDLLTFMLGIYDAILFGRRGLFTKEIHSELMFHISHVLSFAFLRFGFFIDG